MIINKLLPLNLKNIEVIIDNVHQQYKTLTKHEITIIIRTMLETIRLLLITGNSLSIKELFSNMHLINYNQNIKSKLIKIIKCKLTTSKNIK